MAAACVIAYGELDRAVDKAGVRDAEAARIPGFPYLRTNRFLASFAGRDLADGAFEAWVDRLRELDRQGRAIELLNLPAAARQRLNQRLGDRLGPGWSAGRVVERCPDVLRRHDLADPARRDALIARTDVPDDYSLARRTLGVYPLTAIPVAYGFGRWKTANLPVFDVADEDYSWTGTPTLLVPEASGQALTASEVAAILADSRDNPLAIPEPDGEQLERLAMTFAPRFLIDQASDDDRIGHPVWRADGVPGVDPGEPVVFVRLAHGWFDGEPVAQLVYLVWFDARPKEDALDLLGGRLDGLVWRVTLARDGSPLVFDTIHPCGCYHLFFPARDVERVPLPQDRPSDIRETVEVPERAPAIGAERRVTVRVAAVSHYVNGLTGGDASVVAEAVRTYRLVVPDIPDRPMRSMPTTDGGRRSLYRPDGLIDGTERLERFLLWPMGIESAGAMRQWGNHATAFVGHRHFDDPHLLDEAFAR